MFENFIAPYESTITKRLKSIGMIPTGRLNMDEFAMGSTGKTSYYGITKSPWKNKKGEQMSPGGSSSGSAAALAAGTCLASLGTDTGGSVRQPAAWCGLVGYKPTYGLFSRYGVVDFASSIDTPSLFTKDIDDCVFLFKNLIGVDENDYTTVNYEPQKSNKTFCLLIDPECEDEINQNLLDIARVLEKNGYKVRECVLPTLKYMLPSYYVFAMAEASSNLSRYNGVLYGQKLDSIDFEKIRSENFGLEVQMRIAIGNLCYSWRSYEKIFPKSEMYNS